MIVCTQCGQQLVSRQHVAADFLIGAHALRHADGLLTRDRGFYATYFPTLRLIDA
jgi:predicted nucleic acid-binding protein